MKIRLLLTLLLPGLFLISGLAQEQSGREREYYATLKPAELARVWLENNCGVGEENLFARYLKSAATEVTPILVRAWQEGPPGSNVEAIRKAASDRFAAMKKSIDGGETFGLSAEDAKLLKGQSAEDYVESELRNYQVRYKSQALVGLGITGGPEAEEVLAEAVKDPDSVLRQVAQQLRETEKGKGDPPLPRR